MKKAPVLVVTLCRFEHFKRCIESLRSNKDAVSTDLFIALDYPLYESHKEGYEKILRYLETLDGFKSIEIIKRNKNFGATKNLESGIDYLFSKYDFIIISEDDNEFSHNFLEYINKCRDCYSMDKSLFAISGYTYPIKLCIDNNVLDNFVKNKTFFSAWGFGIWKDKYYEAAKCKNINYMNQFMINSSLKVMKSSIKNLYYLMRIIANQKEAIGSDIYFSLFFVTRNMYVLNPIVSKVRNIGWDGSGENCNYNEVYSSQVIDNKCDFDLNGNGELLMNQYNYNLKKYYQLNFNQVMFALTSLMLCKLMGIPIFLKIIHFYKSIKRKING